MLEYLTKNQDLILQAIAASLVVICVVGVVAMLISACFDHAREAKQIREDKLAELAEQERRAIQTKQNSVSKYFAGMADASSAMKENKSLARVIQAGIAYDLAQSGVPGYLKWNAARAIMRELFDVEVED